MNDQPIQITIGYTDAKGYVHLSLSFPHSSGRVLRGEAIWDPSLERVVLGEELESLDRESVVRLKREIRAKCLAK